MLRTLPLLLALGCSFTPGVLRSDSGIGDTGGGGDDAGDSGGSLVTARRKLITIDAGRVVGAHAGFPVWIVLDDPEIAASATTSGADIYFTTEAGVALAHEIQRWVPGTGRLEAWVKLDLSSAASTRFYVRYGELAGAAAPDPAAVFASSFAAVWHLDESLATTSVVDATGQRMGTATALDMTDQVAAHLGFGIDFDGGTERIAFVNPLLGSGPHTMSAWVDARTPTSSYDSIITVGDNMTRQSRWFFTSNFTTNLSAGLYGDDFSSGDNVISDGWILVHWVYDAGTSRIYKNGTQVGNAHTHAGTANTMGLEGYIGWGPMEWGSGGTTTVGLNGVLDEVRIATVGRTAPWIATEHANQTHSAAAPFYSVGAEEPVP